MTRKKKIALICVLCIVAVIVVIAVVAINVNMNRQKADEINEQLKMIYSESLRNAYDSHADDKSINGKVMVYVARESDMESSPYFSLIGKDYYGIDGDLFTADLEECTEVIIIYPDDTQTGSYHSAGLGASVGSAYRTSTNVRVIHLKSGTASFIKTVATNDPPETKAPGGDARGEFVPKEAINYLVELLQ